MRKNSGKREWGWKFLRCSNFKTRTAVKIKSKKMTNTHGFSTFLYFFNHTNSGKFYYKTNFEDAWARAVRPTLPLHAHVHNLRSRLAPICDFSTYCMGKAKQLPNSPASFRSPTPLNMAKPAGHVRFGSSQLDCRTIRLQVKNGFRLIRLPIGLG